MSIHIETTSVRNHQATQDGYWLLELESLTIAPCIQPGQFIHLQIPNRHDVVLRRPFSVFRSSSTSLSLLYKDIGKGTRSMTELKTGDRVNIMGPLGTGFPPVAAETYPVLIAGGYGVAALYLVADRASSRGIIFIGAATSDHVLCRDDFQSLGWEVRIATEDGTLGTPGLITRLFDEWLTQELGARTPVLYACGPMGLLKAVSNRAAVGGWTAWLSLDRHMGCGLGACLACVQKIQDPASPSSWKWARICTEGPVFESRQIVWDQNE